MTTCKLQVASCKSQVASCKLQAIWAKHPSVLVVASGRWGPSVAGNPCLTGQRCDTWDDHYYRSPDDMAALTTRYDTYNRSWPPVFVGEFAANGAGAKPTLRAAVLRCAAAHQACARRR